MNLEHGWESEKERTIDLSHTVHTGWFVPSVILMSKWIGMQSRTQHGSATQHGENYAAASEKLHSYEASQSTSRETSFTEETWQRATLASMAILATMVSRHSSAACAWTS